MTAAPTTRVLAGWLLLAVLLGSPAAAGAPPRSEPPSIAASAASQSPDDTIVAEPLAPAATVPAVAVTVAWQPLERRPSSTLPARLLQRGPPRA